MTDRIIPTYQFDSEHGPARQGREALEVNNPVILYKSGSRWTPSTFVETVVTRVTKTQVTTAEGTRHYRRNGKEVGKATRYDGSSTILVAADEQMVASVNEAREKNAKVQAEREAERAAKTARHDALQHKFWNYADAESVAQVVALMDAWKAKRDAEFDAAMGENK